MPDVLVILAEALPTDRAGPPNGDDRPDAVLIMANDRAVPSLVAQLGASGLSCVVKRLPHLSRHDVEQAMAVSPEAIITVYGHGSPPPDPAIIASRRKQPREVIADTSLLAKPCRWMCMLACFSARICEHLASNARCALISFAERAFVPVPQGRGLFQSSEWDVILQSYDIAFVMPTVLSAQILDPREAVNRCKKLLQETIDHMQERLHESQNPHFLTQIRAVRSNRDSLACV